MDKSFFFITLFTHFPTETDIHNSFSSPYFAPHRTQYEFPGELVEPHM